MTSQRQDDLLCALLCSNLINLDHSNDYAKLKKKGCIGINNVPKLRKLHNSDIIFLFIDIDVFAHISC